jgi:hypothetical protein
MLLSLLNSHSTCTSANSGTCMNERAHNLKSCVSPALLPNLPLMGSRRAASGGAGRLCRPTGPRLYFRPGAPEGRHPLTPNRSFGLRAARGDGPPVRAHGCA